ncbi:hypothetical protein DL93DRAFT_2079325 [Clavulina sp. PMI_390]|nr:hypothetical protein DL93DRAFT_2079325 [Clavulina sp. PMI_390]
MPEDQPRRGADEDYVTILHNIARHNRWALNFNDEPVADPYQRGATSWKTTIVVDGVAMAVGWGTRRTQAHHQAACYLLRHWGYNLC